MSKDFTFISQFFFTTVYLSNLTAVKSFNRLNERNV